MSLSLRHGTGGRSPKHAPSALSAVLVGMHKSLVIAKDSETPSLLHEDLPTSTNFLSLSTNKKRKQLGSARCLNG